MTHPRPAAARPDVIVRTHVMALFYDVIAADKHDGYIEHARIHEVDTGRNPLEWS